MAQSATHTGSASADPAHLSHLHRPTKRWQEVKEVWMDIAGRLHILQDLYTNR